MLEKMSDENKNHVGKTDKTVEVHVFGPTMAAILSTAVCADEDETHAVFGHVSRRRSRDEKKILDFDASNDKEDNAEKIDFSVSLVTRLPVEVWDCQKKEWNQPRFNLWESYINEALGSSSAEDIEFIGLARFRRSDTIATASFSIRDIRLCQYLSQAKKVPIILMAITSSPPGSTHGSTSTNITTGYFVYDNDNIDFDYAEVSVTNIGSKSEAFVKAVNEAAASNKFNFGESMWSPLVESSFQMTEELQQLHFKHQKEMERLVLELDFIKNGTAKLAKLKNNADEPCEADEYFSAKRPKKEVL